MTDKAKLAKHDPPKDSQADAELEVMKSCTTTVAEVVAKSVGAQKGAIEVDGEGFTHRLFNYLFIIPDSHLTKGSGRGCDCDRGRSRHRK